MDTDACWMRAVSMFDCPYCGSSAAYDCVLVPNDAPDAIGPHDSRVNLYVDYQLELMEALGLVS